MHSLLGGASSDSHLGCGTPATYGSSWDSAHGEQRIKARLVPACKLRIKKTPNDKKPTGATRHHCRRARFCSELSAGQEKRQGRCLVTRDH